MNLTTKSISLIPRVSEKAYAQSQEKQTYVFIVPKNTNKQTIGLAVATQFGVTVEVVRIVNTKGKAKRTIRKGGRPVSGRTAAFKKAYVVLKDGDSIPIFASEDDTAKEKK